LGQELDDVVDRGVARDDQRRGGLDEIADDLIADMPAGDIEREAIGAGQSRSLRRRTADGSACSKMSI
jgi:hypothetical protein